MTDEQRKAHEILVRRLDDREEMTRLIQGAINAAILDHKAAGNPIATWRDGKVVLVQPEDIVLETKTAASDEAAVGKQG